MLFLMSDRRTNFKKNLNYLKENKGFTVPFIALSLDMEPRTVEKWFYDKKLPNPKSMELLTRFLKKEYGVTEDQLFESPNKDLGKVDNRVASLDLILRLEQENKALKQQIEKPFTDHSSDSRYQKENERLNERLIELEAIGQNKTERKLLTLFRELGKVDSPEAQRRFLTTLEDLVRSKQDKLSATRGR